MGTVAALAELFIISVYLPVHSDIRRSNPTEGSSVDQVIDLKALLVEREDCDAGTIQKLREGLAQGGTQFKALKEVNDTLRKRLDNAPPALAKSKSSSFTVSACRTPTTSN